MIKSVILAAGKGSRMKSDTPKVLHKIFDKAILGYVIDAVQGAGLTDECFVITGHLAEQVNEYTALNYGNVKCVLQNPQAGTGHAVSMLLPLLDDFKGNLLILCGDTPLITSKTIKEFINFHNRENSDLTVMSAEFDNPKDFGRIIRNSDGSLNSIVEEKDADDEQRKIKEVNAGIYCINWEKLKPAFSELTADNAQREYYLTDIISWGRRKNLCLRAYTLQNNEEIYGINSKTDLAEAARLLNNLVIKKHLETGVTVVDPLTTRISPDTEIGADTVIYPSCYISGKNKIGRHCQIGPFAHLRGDVVLEDYVKIGNFVEVKKTTVKSHTNACHLSYLGDSEIGSDVNIGAGTITANYNPLTKVKSKTVIKNHAKIGSNSVLVAPVTIEEGANVGALGIITRDIPKWALAVTRAPLKILEQWVKRHE